MSRGHMSGRAIVMGQMSGGGGKCRETQFSDHSPMGQKNGSLADLQKRCFQKRFHQCFEFSFTSIQHMPFMLFTAS